MTGDDYIVLLPSVFWSTTQATCMVGSLMVVAALFLRHMQAPTTSKAPATPATASTSAADHLKHTSSEGFGYGLSLRDALNPVSSIDFNSSTPVPIDTPLFHGQAHVLVRPPHGDARWDALFAGKRRLVWVMVQGQFKRAPTGTVYLAGELPRTMALSLWTKAWASMIIATVRTLIGHLHFSFGDDVEAPHVALPLYQSADQFVATPADAVPPALGLDGWGESAAAQKTRKATPVGAEVFRTDVVYSFQFHTMYIDLTSWSVVNIPGVADMSLAHFFGDMSLRLSVYEHKQVEAAHVAKEYCFAFDVARTPTLASSTAGHDVAASAATVAESAAMKVDFATIEFDVWMWLEYFDAPSQLRPVAYVLRVRQDDSKVYTVIVPSEAVQTILDLNADGAAALKVRARQDAYAAIDDQTVDVGRRLHAIAHGGRHAAKQELHHWLTTASPMTLAAANSMDALGVSVWSWRRAGMNVIHQGSGYRILSDTCLRQEYVVLTSTSLQFFRTYASSPCRKVPVTHITHVGCRYLHDLYVLVVHTWTEVIYVHVPDPMTWHDVLAAHCDRSQLRTSSAFVKLTQWTPFNALTYEGYVVLNARKIAPHDEPRSTNIDHPTDVAQRAVAAGVRAWTARTLAHKRAFQVAAHQLRFVDLSRLDSSEAKLAFFMNVYQALLMHLHLALQDPTSVCMHQVIYAVGVQKLNLSLAEIEFVVLRGGLPPVADVPYLDFVPARTAYPSTYGAVAVTARDFRISTALFGHRADRTAVVYAPETVHAQLNAAVAAVCHDRIVLQGHVVTLPRVCRWFAADFGGQSDLVARKLLGFLTNDTCRDALQTLMDAPNLFFSTDFKDVAVTAAPSCFRYLPTSA